MGTPQTDDVLCYETPEHPKWMTHAEVTEDGEWRQGLARENEQARLRVEASASESGDEKDRQGQGLARENGRVGLRVEVYE